ncbi:MAG: glycosyltransferase family 4 protein [Nitrospirae bacterium]|nr:glycosyltransferase family 4 protein [Nitrospirota bacterium]
MSDRLTILHTEASEGWGGQEIRILEEAVGHQRRGHRVLVAASPRSAILSRARKAGVETATVEMGRARLLQVVRDLRRLIRDCRVQVVHTHSSRDSWIGGLAARSLPQRPILVRTRHLSTPISRSWLSRLVYQQLPDLVITTGEAIRKEMIETNGYDPGRIVSIPTGVDLERFTFSLTARQAIRCGLGLPEDVSLIGIVAVLRSWKGHLDFLEAAARVLKEEPLSRFLIVGDGPQRDRIRAAIQRLGLEPRVWMLGHREDVPDILSAMDLFVLPSFGHEGVPQAVLQALAVGLPVVASRTGSIPEVIHDGQTGALVPPRQPDLLASAILRLVRNREEGRLLGQSGKSLVQQHHSLESMLDRIEWCYDGLFGKDRACRSS